MKSAAYAATRNLYPDLVTSIKSLLYNSDVDRIHLMLEDDEFPEWLPPQCEIINVSGQKIFPPGSPNYDSGWTYMTLMRAAYHRYYPEDRVLSLDVDTVVMQDISHLWDLDLSGCHFAGVAEKQELYKPGFHYVNGGVLMMNLDFLRETGRGDEVINALNKRRFSFPEQDAFNYACQPAVLHLPQEYNAGRGTKPYGEPIIRHWMGEHDIWHDDPAWLFFKAMTWEEALSRRF